MGERKPSEAERIKLTANFLNTTASGVLLAAVVVPFVGYALGTLHATIDTLTVAALSTVGLTVAFVIHFVARWLLAELDE